MFGRPTRGTRGAKAWRPGEPEPGAGPQILVRYSKEPENEARVRERNQGEATAPGGRVDPAETEKPLPLALPDLDWIICGGKIQDPKSRSFEVGRPAPNLVATTEKNMEEGRFCFLPACRRLPGC
jgi:hypothetical protein